METWSIEEWCNNRNHISHHHHDANQLFLEHLDLPFRHPFCDMDPSSYALDGVPPQGPLNHEQYYYYTTETVLEMWITFYKMIAPSILGMTELWFRLFASLVAPCGTFYMLYCFYNNNQRNTTTSIGIVISWWTIISSIILMTDTLYVLEYGNGYGMSLFVASVSLGWLTTTSTTSSSLIVDDDDEQCCQPSSTHSSSMTRQRRTIIITRMGILILVCIAVGMCYDLESGRFLFGDTKETSISIDPGLYYDREQQQSLVDHWKLQSYTSTPWMPTGDSRTGLPFLMNSIPNPKYTRVWLTMEDDQEVVALDIAFPKSGFQIDRPVYLVLHGLNGGSYEEYVKDLVHRCNDNENSTVIVMVARGLMDLPIRGYNIFHGARWQDAHQAASRIKAALSSYHAASPSFLSTSSASEPELIGVGYSMGATILSNMVARTGKECALDAAIAISGGLDMRAQIDYHRAQRLWQPMLCQELRDAFVLGKWGQRVQSRLTKAQMKQLMRATHVTEIDQTAVVVYHGFRDLVHYYTEMSALGDVPLDELHSGNAIHPSRRIHDISIPLVVVQSMDDPIISWRTVASNSGPMHPSNLTQNTGNGNLIILLTKAGGHVGYPTGWLPFVNKWKWMSEVSISFARALVDIKNQKRNIVGIGRVDALAA